VSQQDWQESGENTMRDLRFLIILYVLALIIFPLIFILEISITLKESIKEALSEKHNKKRGDIMSKQDDKKVSKNKNLKKAAKTDKVEVNKVATPSQSVSPTDARLNKTVSASVTQQMKDVVKEVAGGLNTSVSAFTRQSLNDEVYHDLHPEASVPDLVQAGHEKKSVIHTEASIPDHVQARHKKKSVIHKEPIVKQQEDIVITENNTVSVLTLIKYFKLLKLMNKEDDKIDIIFTKDKAQLINHSKKIWVYINVPQWHGDLAFSTNFIPLYKLLTTIKVMNTKAEQATFLKQDNEKIVIRFSHGQSVSLVAATNTTKEVSFIHNGHLDNAEKVAQIKSTDLNTLLKSIEYAQATDASLTNLHSVYFEIEDGKLILVAVDGYRLGYLEYVIKHEKPYKLLVSTEVIDILMNILDSFKDEKSVDIFISKQYIEFQVGDDTLIAELLDAETFPDYRRVIPPAEDFRYIIEVDANELYDGIKSFATFYKSQATQQVILKLNKGKNDMEISAKASEIGESELSIPIKVMKDHLDGDIKIGFNPEFLMQPLKLWSSYGYDKHPDNKVVLEVVEPTKPMVMLPKGSTKTLAVIMPIKLQE